MSPTCSRRVTDVMHAGRTGFRIAQSHKSGQKTSDLLLVMRKVEVFDSLRIDQLQQLLDSTTQASFVEFAHHSRRRSIARTTDCTFGTPQDTAHAKRLRS